MTSEPRPPLCDHPECQHTGAGWSHHPCCVVRMVDDTDPYQYAAPLDGPTTFRRWLLSPAEGPLMDLDSIRDLVKKALDPESALHAISDIEDADSHQRVIGIETDTGERYFLTIQPA